MQATAKWPLSELVVTNRYMCDVDRPRGRLTVFTSSITAVHNPSHPRVQALREPQRPDATMLCPQARRMRTDAGRASSAPAVSKLAVEFNVSVGTGAVGGGGVMSDMIVKSAIT